MRTQFYCRFLLAICGLCTTAGLAPAQSLVGQGALESTASMELMQAEEDALQAAADRVQDCVVQIETFGGLQMVANETVSEGPSSGTVVDSDGWIITSLFQFRNNPASITVVLADGQRKAARVVARDHNRELALLKVEVDQPLPIAVPVSRSKMVTGQWTIALGKTFDPQVASRSVGILSAVRRIWDKAIQTDAKVSPLNYGGPLVNLYGETLGILAPIDPGIATEGEVQQWYDSGVGFAIPLEDILQRLPILKTGQDIHAGLLGFRPESRDDFSKDVVVAGVIPGTPLAAAGFRKGDRLKQINGQEITFVNQLRHLMGPFDAGQTIKLTVERDGELISRECELVKELPVYSNPFIGLLLAKDSEDAPVHVLAVEQGGPAEKAGIKPGDALLAFGETKLETVDDFSSKLTFSDYRQPVTLSVRSEGGDARDVTVPLEKWPESSELQIVVLQELLKKEAASDQQASETELREAGLVDLPFADVPNKVFAYVPDGDKQQPVGLFLVAAEPGVELDRKKIVDAWQTFCREQDYILCVVSSAAPQAWSMEELEVFDRALAHLRDHYTLDSRRLVVGGFNSGGTIALVEAFENLKDFRALYFGHDRGPSRMRMPAAEPQLAIDFLFGELNKSVEAVQANAQKRGYRVESLGAKCSLTDGPSNTAGKQLRDFLATLAWW